MSQQAQGSSHETRKPSQWVEWAGTTKERCGLLLGLRQWRTTLLGLGLATLFLAGCAQQMGNQPRLDPLEASTFFTDGAGSRPLVAGTVARGELRIDHAYFAGTKGNVQAKRQAGRLPEADYVAKVPLDVTEAVLARGQQRYGINCAHCHGTLGDGNGKIVQRGYAIPPKYWEPRLVKAPDGYIFDVITNGFGAMPDHAALITVPDRWAIVTYVRALQRRAEGIPLAEIPETQRQRLEGEKKQ